MPSMKHNPGIILSGIFHFLILAIPVSFAVVQKYKEVEMFVITDEKPLIQRHTVQKKDQAEEVKKEIIKEMPPVEKPQRIDEVIPAKEEMIRSVAAQEKEKTAIVPLEAAHPPQPVAQETVPAPQVFSSQDISIPKDVEFGTATGPKFLHKEMPVYPLVARRLNKEGNVVLRLTIDSAGKLMNIEVMENAGYGFTEAAREAVQKSTFMPAKRDGRSVACRALLPIRFKIGRDL
ncbi:MAG: TonB family protein [Thermodesulfovibrionales bacterium]|nr:TonB family protein [Thermodesulfovibrionales bacterium]